MKNEKLNRKVAVVTGESKRIGAGIAKLLAAEGAPVVVNYGSSRSDADKVFDEIAKGGGKAVAVQGDVANKSDITEGSVAGGFTEGEFRKSLESQTAGVAMP